MPGQGGCRRGREQRVADAVDDRDDHDDLPAHRVERDADGERAQDDRADERRRPPSCDGGRVGPRASLREAARGTPPTAVAVPTTPAMTGEPVSASISSGYAIAPNSRAEVGEYLADPQQPEVPVPPSGADWFSRRRGSMVSPDTATTYNGALLRPSTVDPWPTGTIARFNWGRSSVGRALDWQSRGSRVQVPSPPPRKSQIRGVSDRDA